MGYKISPPDDNQSRGMQRSDRDYLHGEIADDMNNNGEYSKVNIGILP